MVKIIFYLCDRILVRAFCVERDISLHDNSVPDSRTIPLCVIFELQVFLDGSHPDVSRNY